MPVPGKKRYPRVIQHVETRVVTHDLHTGEVSSEVVGDPSKIRVVRGADVAPPEHERLVGHRVIKPKGQNISSRPVKKRRRKAERQQRLPSGRRERR